MDDATVTGSEVLSLAGEVSIAGVGGQGEGGGRGTAGRGRGRGAGRACLKPGEHHTHGWTMLQSLGVRFSL